MKFEQCKALITGGASGLGLATAKSVIAAGGSVAVLDIKPEQSRATVAELGDRAKFLRLMFHPRRPLIKQWPMLSTFLAKSHWQ